ncbi:two-component response regulator-like APRR2 isoform X1 [Beta vulgaris subsp. vulgaris]|uniref:two-component response regulator-like APRR2 isoform X1 n=1 Tax=Beta vulgaris subsp. vulgaris TaxID=3555 RepID=UPI0020372713|nr:two-component response regulator-like APRR2 isoform X1 [Beta vulgaris subsp. vulgaris]XP_010677298.2 two-component response regulator-like APRR2 isoform X1 [Beta vulgaris subsp. vulgaris]XP_019105079.2 two-component response regulator-like APRR2 isoform X1 [Beta vulgaris subsp. vulgaris]XP_048500793.1 two-component response regulator-like APRR2 isoform X1 [Beta vulgaris subsp. vulgaris]
MVCTANDLLEWKNFPKGLKILLLDEDTDSAAEIKSKLEEMEYIVIAFASEHEALCAISSKNESFHVAIVEVSIDNRDGRCNFLETAKDLPTIMTSKERCLSTMMKCIALGAVEFLVKPLSEEKLRNIWQHVVHKAFNTSGSAKSESVDSVKEFVGSILEIQQQNIATQTQVTEKPMIDTEVDQRDHDQSASGDKFPAPSTPQIKQSGRSLDDGDYPDQTNGSPIKEGGECDEETKSVDNTYNGESSAKMEVDPPQPTSVVVIKEEEDRSDGSRGTDISVPQSHDKEDANVSLNSGNSNKESKNVRGTKGSRRKLKVDWTPDLHKRFVQAVEQLGVDQAIPSRILELMKVEGLTRHNIASHLQKYRMHRRHILPKQEERRWPHPRDSMQRNYYSHRPVMAYPPYHTNHTFTSGQVYPMWGQQGCQPHGYPMWGPPSYPWQPAENWPWKPYPAMHADAWGCPVMPPPSCPTSAFPQQVQGAYGFHSPDSYGKNSADINPGEEVIDKVVKEAINKPWLPLPIGLKPPSTDSVLAELSRQGISIIPHHPC